MEVKPLLAGQLSLSKLLRIPKARTVTLLLKGDSEFFIMLTAAVSANCNCFHSVA